MQCTRWRLPRLVRYEYDNETWWVPKSNISQLTNDNLRRSVKKINYCKDDCDEPPAKTRDSGKEEDRKICSPKNSDNVLDKSQTHWLSIVVLKATMSLFSDKQNGALTIPAASTAAVENLTPVQKPKLHKNTSDLHQLSLTFHAVSGHTVRNLPIKDNELNTALGMHANERDYLAGTKGMLGKK